MTWRRYMRQVGERYPSLMHFVVLLIALIIALAIAYLIGARP